MAFELGLAPKKKSVGGLQPGGGVLPRQIEEMPGGHGGVRVPMEHPLGQQFAKDANAQKRTTTPSPGGYYIGQREQQAQSAPQSPFQPQGTVPSPLGPVTPVRPEFKGYDPEEKARRIAMAQNGELGGRMMGNQFFPTDPYRGTPQGTVPDRGFLPQGQDGLGPLSKALLAGQHPITSPTGPDINPSPIGRVPSPPNMIGSLGLTAPPPAAQPLGGYASNQAGFDARMKAENTLGNFGGTLPVRGADGRVAFADGPMKDLGQKPQFGKDSGASYRFTGKETGEIDPVTGKMGMQYIGNNTPEQQKARETFDARRGGLEARKAAYEGRQSSERSERSAGVLANAQARKEGRAEKVRIQKGRLTFDERLAMQDPQSAALKADANGRLGLAREQGAARIAAQKDTLAAQERMATANNASREKIAGLGLAKANGTDANGKPIDNRTPAQKIAEAPKPEDLQGKSPAEQEVLLDGLPKDTKERLIREANKPGLIGQIESTPFLGDIAGGLPGDVISAYMNPHGLAAGLLGVQQKPTVNARTSQITNDQLKDQPGDRPGTLRAKAEMRKKRGL